MNISIERNVKEQTEINMLKRKLALRFANLKISFFILVTVISLIIKLLYPDRESVTGNVPLAMISLGLAIMLYYESHFNDGLLPKKIETSNTKTLVYININDLSITVETPDILVRRSWKMIKKYKINKHFILLFDKRAMYQNMTIIKREELSNQDFDELIGFLKANKIMR